MRRVPDFVLRAALDELEEAREWLRTIHAPEKKELRDQTPIAVAYWIDRADEKVREVMAALDRFDIDDDDTDINTPEAFPFTEPDQDSGESRSDVPPRVDGDLVPPS